MTTTDSLLTRFVRWLNSKLLLHQAPKMTKRELSRQTPDCIGAKLFNHFYCFACLTKSASWDLMRCCEAWKPIEDCFDTLSFECIDFQRLSQIFASLTRENPYRHVKLRSQPSLGRKQKETLL